MSEVSDLFLQNETILFFVLILMKCSLFDLSAQPLSSHNPIKPAKKPLRMLSQAAKSIWDAHYASDPGTICVKLQLGADAFERAVGGSQQEHTAGLIRSFTQLLESNRRDMSPALAAVNEKLVSLGHRSHDQTAGLLTSISKLIEANQRGLTPSLAAVNDKLVTLTHRHSDQTAGLLSSLSQLLDNSRRDLSPLQLIPSFTALDHKLSSLVARLDAEKDLSATKDRLTSKGRTAEGDLVQMLRAAGMARVDRIDTKDDRGKMGGDIVMSDLYGTGCVVEVKNKAHITQDDFDKFEEDVNAWKGPETIFVFIRSNGAGNCRKLSSKPTYAVTPSGKTLIWFKGTASEFSVQIGFILPLVTGFAQERMRSSGNAEVHAALCQSFSSLQIALSDVRRDLGELEKRKGLLQKREKILLKSVQDGDPDLLVPLTKRPRYVRLSDCGGDSEPGIAQ